MKKSAFDNISVDYIEIYVPIAKPLAYWHRNALGFSIEAYSGPETNCPGISSYLMKSQDIRLLLTCTFETDSDNVNPDVAHFVSANSCGVKRVVFDVPSVTDSFDNAVVNGAIPVRFPAKIHGDGYIEEASVKLFEHCEITFINRDHFHGYFRPGFKQLEKARRSTHTLFTAIDHIASELRINEADFWTEYLAKAIGTSCVQRIGRSEENQTGMVLNISQTSDLKAFFVMTEAAVHSAESRVQKSVVKFGPGIHHLAFSTDDIIKTTRELKACDVEFVSFPPAYYEQLRLNPDYEDMDINTLEQEGILIDKEDDTYLLQKFLKPMGDRPYFFYEIIQRVNGYSGFALKNITALRKAEEIQITQVVKD